MLHRWLLGGLGLLFGFWLVGGPQALGQGGSSDAGVPQAGGASARGTAAPHPSSASPRATGAPARRAAGTPPVGVPAAAGHYAHAAVASDRALASEAAVQVLREGGNAADAAAAALLALGVVNPSSSGFGGGGFALYYDNSPRARAASPDAADVSSRLTFIDFRERAPRAATPDMFVDAPPGGTGPISAASQLGGLASGVPGEPAGVVELVERFGRTSLASVAAPAIALAESGFEVDAAFADTAMRFRDQLWVDATLRRWFGPSGELHAGDRLVQPELARTLRAFARGGRGSVYGGPIGRAIVRANNARGGRMTLADLQDYQVVRRVPVSAVAFGHLWVSAPPPSAGGTTMLGSVRQLAALRPVFRTSQSALRHALLESWKGPFLDRERYFGDPDHVPVPLAQLLDPTRDAQRALRFHPFLALDPRVYDLPLAQPTGDTQQPDNAGTSHFCVVDEEGSVAAVTSTVNLPFGARYSAGGFVLNDQMDDFAREVGERNAYGLVGGVNNLPGPGRRPVSSMSPTILFDSASRPVLCVGASGGSRIVTATEQVALDVVLLGMSVEDAVAAPRVHHQADPNVFNTEMVAPLTEAELAALLARGHAHQPIRNIAIVQAIQLVHGADGGPPALHAASDGRKGGRPAGY
ncbi:MAG: gamma-glutamyltransferase [Sandaracinaceae bacterium]|nr:gamma-glutamyltransferase [Sandaracinaceae bacterium]